MVKLNFILPIIYELIYIYIVYYILIMIQVDKTYYILRYTPKLDGLCRMAD